MCVYTHTNSNGPAVLSWNTYKHMWYVKLVTTVVVMVACDALAETYFQLLYIFCINWNTKVGIVHSIPYLLIFYLSISDVPKRERVFVLSSVGRDVGSGWGMALLSTNKSSVCSEDDLSVRVVPQLLTTHFLNFVASWGLSGRQTPLVRGIECCHGKLKSASSSLWCWANYLSGSCH